MEKISGKVTCQLSSGLYFIEGDDGVEYISHFAESEDKIKVGKRVSFYPGLPKQGGKYPWATDVTREFKPFCGIPAWEVLPPKARKAEKTIKWVRCNQCGQSSAHLSSYCPWCGCKLEKDPEMKQYAREVYTDLRERDEKGEIEWS